MTTPKASAYPRKRFFFEMFTRDISLEDCILDLIDNSIDGVVRSRNIRFTDSILSPELSGKHDPNLKLPTIEVSYSATRFQIKDTCGGISRKRALNDVFNFGHGPGESDGALGVYGIGLKRAIFKLGNHFQMTSRTDREGFSVDLNLKNWVAKDNKLEDWRIPLQYTAGAESQAVAGTDIKITQLRTEVVMRLNDGTLAQRLHTIISQTYGLFIGKYVQIMLNGRKVEPFHIPIGDSDQVTPAYEEYKDGKVTVKLFASLAARVNDTWPSDPAGWYALCNGRIVVAADKTDLTGWGSLGFPQFHDGKHRGFVGVAFFESSDPLALPWTTTKRGLYRESPVYLHARNRMIGVARPIIRFLDSMYKPDSPEEPGSRAIANAITQTGLPQIASRPATSFSITRVGKKRPKTTVRVQYDAEMADVQRVRAHIKKPGWGANQVGKYTFDYYLKTECPDDRSL